MQVDCRVSRVNRFLYFFATLGGWNARLFLYLSCCPLSSSLSPSWCSKIVRARYISINNAIRSFQPHRSHRPFIGTKVKRGTQIECRFLQSCLGRKHPAIPHGPQVTWYSWTTILRTWCSLEQVSINLPIQHITMLSFSTQNLLPVFVCLIRLSSWITLIALPTSI